MLRMYLLQCWFNLSDEGVEDAIYDNYAMRKFVGIDFFEEDAPDATTLLKFRRLLEKHNLNEAFFGAINRVMVESSHIMKGGTIINATIINAPSSTKSAEKKRDPEMHQTKKGNEWLQSGARLQNREAPVWVLQNSISRTIQECEQTVCVVHRC